MSLLIELCERGLIPDGLTRFGMRRLMAARLRRKTGTGVRDSLGNFAAVWLICARVRWP